VSSTSSGGQTAISYSSQSTLLANDFTAVKPSINPLPDPAVLPRRSFDSPSNLVSIETSPTRIDSRINPNNAELSRSPSGDKSMIVDPALNIYRPVLGTTAVSSPATGDEQGVYIRPESKLERPGSPAVVVEQLSLPRPVFIPEGARQRVHSFMPPPVAKKPLRAERVEAAEVGETVSQQMDARSYDASDESSVYGATQGTGRLFQVQADISAPPTSHHISAPPAPVQDVDVHDEKHMIGEVFKFLDDVE